MAALNVPVRNPLQAAFASIRAPVTVVFVFSLFLNILAFVAPVFMLQVYDRVLTSRNETTLLMLAVIAVILIGAWGLLEKYRHRVLVQASVMFDRGVADKAFDAALQAGLRTRGSHHSQIVRDVDSIRDFIGGNAILTLFDAPWVPVYLGVCFLFHPWIGAVATVGAIVLFILAWANDRMTGKLIAESSKQGIQSLAGLAAALRNAEAIRALGMAPAIRGRWRKSREASLTGQVSAMERGGGLLSLSKFFRMALQIAILGVSAYLVLEQQVSGGVMFAASMIMGKALAPVEQAVSQWRGFVGARGANKRLREIFGAFPAADKRMILDAPKGDISVENLAVTAPGTQVPIIRGVTFSLKAGEVLAILGPTGSGKSTLARAIVGAWPIAAGNIRIDGHDLRHWDPDQIGACLGYLPQDVELFAGTIAENIARFGEVDEQGVLTATRKANALDVVQKMSNGFSTVVGEDGAGLSGGQRQRVGLARALYGEPNVVVLDEPNSNLDGDGDMALMHSIKAMKDEGRTVIVIAHRRGVLAVADKVLVMHEGGMRKFGPRDEVMQQLDNPGGPGGRAVSVAA